MHLKITRDILGEHACTGILEVLDDAGNKIFECYTLEENVAASERHEDGTFVGGKDERIPAGVYNLRRHDARNEEGVCVSKYAPKIAQWTGEDSGPINVYNDEVPASRLILIHWGNTDKDTLGCILLGYTRDGGNFIGNSQNCCNKFYNIMKDVDLSSCQLEIVNAF